jgi:AbrB family looped-hinge helix DNA binding protein
MSKVVSSRVTSKGQVTVPEEIRKTLGIEQGDRLEWTAAGKGRVEVRKVRGRISNLVGLLGKPKRSATVEEMDEALRRRFRKEHARG